MWWDPRSHFVQSYSTGTCCLPSLTLPPTTPQSPLLSPHLTLQHKKGSKDSDVAFSSSCPFSRYLFSFSFFFFQKKEKEETQFLFPFFFRERRRTSFRDANKVLPNTLKLQGESQLLLFNHTCWLTKMTLHLVSASMMSLFLQPYFYRAFWTNVLFNASKQTFHMLI